MPFVDKTLQVHCTINILMHNVFHHTDTVEANTFQQSPGGVATKITEDR